MNEEKLTLLLHIVADRTSKETATTSQKNENQRVQLATYVMPISQDDPLWVVSPHALGQAFNPEAILSYFANDAVSV